MARGKDHSIEKWKARIRQSIEERKRKQPDWDMIYKYFRGTQWKQYQTPEGDLTIVNLVYSHVKSVVPATYSRNPKMYFNPTRPDTVDKARLTEMAINGQMHRMKLKETNKRITQDVVLYGSGFSKATYEVEGEYSENSNDQRMLSDLQQRFRNVSGTPFTGGKVGKVSAQPMVRRVDPRNIGFAVGSTDISDPGFIWHRTVKRVGSVKSDPYYKNTRNLAPSLSLDDTLREQLRPIWDLVNDEEFGLLEMYEIWDLSRGEPEVFVIAEGHDKFLVEPYEHDYPCDHVFDLVKFTPLDDQIWGESEILPWINNQDELNKIRTMQLAHIKRFNRKYAVLSNAIDDEDDLQGLEQGVDGTILLVRGVPRASDAVHPIADAPMPSDIYKVNAIVEDDIVKVGRITPYRRGATEGANTATEANIVETNAQLGDVDRVDALSALAISQMDKVRRYMREFTPGVQIVQMTGNPLDGQVWEAWRKQDIDIESEMHVEFGSTAPGNDGTRLAKAVQIYDRAVANPTVNPQAAFARLLEAAGERDQTGWFLPDPLVKIQLMAKAMAGQEAQKGVSPTAPVGEEPGPDQPVETEAELEGRAASA